VSEPAVDVVCCPHAGGAADFFRDWPRAFGPDVRVAGVQYPGHGDRVDEPCLTDVRTLSDRLADELAPRAGRTVLFGHSFGAAVAYETAVLLTARGCPPRAVLVSARRAPHLEGGDAGRLPGDAEIWRETVRLGGTPAEIAEDPEWREVLTPSLRADFHANATYRPSARRLPCPLTALVGRDDDDVPRSVVDAWHGYTASGFAVGAFDGGHFYLLEHVAAIAAEVKRVAASTGLTDSPTTPLRATGLMVSSGRPRAGGSDD
jgi:surfactin synthase thioesterase subunit